MGEIMLPWAWLTASSAYRFLKIAACIAAISVFAAHYLANRPDALASLAPSEKAVLAAIAAGKVDPITTGALRSAATDTRLDPCGDTRR